jgi:uncharacterized membrane protein YdbT with pleckstrin-like domain
MRAEVEVEGQLVSLLRLPSQPQPPGGEQGSLRVFRAAPGYFRYRLARWGLGQLGALVGLVVGFSLVAHVAPRVAERSPLAAEFMRHAEWFGVGVYLVQLALTGALLRLDYRMRWYMVTDRSLRVREGLVVLREKTLTFANVQQVAVEQGPLQRLFGISDVRVRTAGGGSGGHKKQEAGGATEAAHEACMRGVSDAPALRDLVQAGVRRHRDAGLGDPDEAAALPVSGAQAVSPEAVDAARELLAEMRELRARLTQGG